jgi:serine protease Do
MVSLRHRLMGVALVCGLTWAGVLSAAPPAASVSPAAPAITAEQGLAALEVAQAGYRAVHAKVSPAVVSITSRMDSGAADGPLDSLGGTRSSAKTSAGSGVIIRPEGIVLTNSHVVADAVQVTVTLSDSDKALKAEVIQMDTRTDLAVVRILEKGTYPTAVLGDATTVEVGDFAIAIGNPFRLASTMTVGHISATGRRLRGPVGDFNYNDLLQTDAAINPGNSGGALVNIRGELVGVNFMIYTPGDTGGSVGIGFAIPINDYTKEIIATLASGKPYERGRVGVNVRNLDDALREQFGVKDGIFVEDVVPGQPAAKANIKAEDVIVDFGGTKITDVDQFVRLVERTKPNTVVQVNIIRAKKPMTIPVTVGAVPNTGVASQNERKTGLRVTTLTPDIAARLRLSVNNGVLVAAVTPGSAGDDANLQPGDVIMRVGAEDEVRTAEDFWASLTKNMAVAKFGVVVRIQRGSRQGTVTMPVVKLK